MEIFLSFFLRFLADSTVLALLGWHSLIMCAKLLCLCLWAHKVNVQTLFFLFRCCNVRKIIFLLLSILLLKTLLALKKQGLFFKQVPEWLKYFWIQFGLLSSILKSFTPLCFCWTKMFLLLVYYVNLVTRGKLGRNNLI